MDTRYSDLCRHIVGVIGFKIVWLFTSGLNAGIASHVVQRAAPRLTSSHHKNLYMIRRKLISFGIRFSLYFIFELSRARIPTDAIFWSRSAMSTARNSGMIQNGT